jgi:hypothetical protein
VAANDLRGHERGIFTNGKVKYFYKEGLSSTIWGPAVPLSVDFRHSRSLIRMLTEAFERGANFLEYFFQI